MDNQDKLDLMNLSIKDIYRNEKEKLNEQFLNLDLISAKIFRVPINHCRAVDKILNIRTKHLLEYPKDFAGDFNFLNLKFKELLDKSVLKKNQVGEDKEEMDSNFEEIVDQTARDNDSVYLLHFFLVKRL